MKFEFFNLSKIWKKKKQVCKCDSIWIIIENKMKDKCIQNNEQKISSLTNDHIHVHIQLYIQ